MHLEGKIASVYGDFLTIRLAAGVAWVSASVLKTDGPIDEKADGENDWVLQTWGLTSNLLKFQKIQFFDFITILGSSILVVR